MILNQSRQCISPQTNLCSGARSTIVGIASAGWSHPPFVLRPVVEADISASLHEYAWINFGWGTPLHNMETLTAESCQQSSTTAPLTVLTPAVSPVAVTYCSAISSKATMTDVACGEKLDTPLEVRHPVLEVCLKYYHMSHTAKRRMTILSLLHKPWDAVSPGQKARWSFLGRFAFASSKPSSFQATYILKESDSR